MKTTFVFRSGALVEKAEPHQPMIEPLAVDHLTLDVLSISRDIQRQIFAAFALANPHVQRVKISWNGETMSYAVVPDEEFYVRETSPPERTR